MGCIYSFDLCEKNAVGWQLYKACMFVVAVDNMRPGTSDGAKRYNDR